MLLANMALIPFFTFIRINNLCWISCQLTPKGNMGHFGLEQFLDVYLLLGLYIDLTCLEGLTCLGCLLMSIACQYPQRIATDMLSGPLSESMQSELTFSP